VPFLAGGQRLGPGLPWYRGQAGAPLEAESQALCELVAAELLGRRVSMALDCHSGFGFSDRIWFPFAHTPEPIRHLAEIHALQEIYLQSYSQHQYRFEPQSLQYLTHGDLWDHLYLQACQASQNVFLPLTLEMGSWAWIKKNPRQFFSRSGIFNPLVAHRQQRVLRRHMAFLDFLGRAACGHAQWAPTGAARSQRQRDALAHWYG
ncbi:MAG: zinc carboxypeptidase, partial [Polaromonas sp.]|nr:zinc carboxypeptidase [Polaromonas sp.]